MTHRAAAETKRRCASISYVKTPWRPVIASAILFGLAPAQVRITQQKTIVHVEIDGKPFGDFYTGNDLPKPYFAPLRSASGKIVTRQWPMMPDSTETHDHQHHRGMWLGYIDINGVNFWENEFSYHRPNAGKIVANKVGITRATGTTGTTGTIRGTFDWLDPSGKKLLSDARTLTFYSDPSLRTIDFDATFTAAVKIVFADDKDGAFAVRMADPLTEKTGAGVITSSSGGRTMREVWGKPADWVDYSGTLDGEAVGIAIMDHPTSFHHPARWHARDYGLFAVNPFASHAYDPAAPVSSVTLEPGGNLRLRYRVVIHPKLDNGVIEQMYKTWAAEK